MAFNTNTPRASYIATSGQTVFPFTFKIFTDTNITVYKNQVALVLSTNYTVTINGDSGGSVTLLVGASLNDEIVLVRSLAITRDFDYQDNGDFFADTVDSDQDYQTYLVQDVDAKFLRTFKLPDAISGTVSSELPLPVNDAYICWNSDSTAIINDTTIPNAVIEATTQAGIAVTKAGEASTSASNALASEVQAGVYASQLDPSKIVAKDSPTGSAMMPAGTTAQRPVSPSNGYMRYNTDLLKFEGYQGGVWGTLGGLDINTLTTKATPIDADGMVLADSTSSFSLKKFTWANLKATLLVYFDTLYSRTTAIFGVGQTWQDVTGSRVSGTTYTNSTGKPICISISGTRNSSASPGSLQLTINDVIVGYAATSEAQSTWNALRETIFGVIPHGGTYYITGTNNIINTWSELR